MWALEVTRSSDLAVQVLVSGFLALPIASHPLHLHLHRHRPHFIIIPSWIALLRTTIRKSPIPLVILNFNSYSTLTQPHPPFNVFILDSIPLSAADLSSGFSSPESERVCAVNRSCIFADFIIPICDRSLHRLFARSLPTIILPFPNYNAICKTGDKRKLLRRYHRWEKYSRFGKQRMPASGRWPALHRPRRPARCRGRRAQLCKCSEAPVA